MEELYRKAKEKIKEKNYREAVSVLTELTSRAEERYKNCSGKRFSFNHILEVYYYAYFKKDVSKLEYTDCDINAFYRMLGFAQMHLDRHIDAIKSYDMAIKWNPVDLDTYLQLGELYKKGKNLEALKKVTSELYNYCCTRATMARFYRNMGFYYLEKSDPETAGVLYTYSNIYYHTEHADRELEFVARALQRDAFSYPLSYMQQVLDGKQIPKGPNSDTIGITYRVGQLELEAGNLDNARECFMMVYDLTQDEEVEKILKEQL